MSVIAPEDHLPPPQRRTRHITCLQIRNLTPFPARDALAQSLTQPSPSSFTLPQQSSDDVELTTSRRMRRISSSSVSTIINLAAEECSPGSIPRKQGRSFSKGSLQGKNSKASFVMQGPIPNGAEEAINPEEQDVVPYSGLFLTHSQIALEKIVKSRLIETFMTLTLLPSFAAPVPPSLARPFSSPSPPPFASPGSRKRKDTPIQRTISASAVSHRRGTSTSSSSSGISTSHTGHSQSVARPSSPAMPRHRAMPNHRATGASSKAVNFPSPPPTPPPESPRLGLPPSANTPQNVRPLDTDLMVDASLEIPFYISTIHLPSTNPKFLQIDAQTEFASWADTSGSQLKASIWGRTHEGIPQTTTSFGRDMKGKSKASTSEPSTSLTSGDSAWRVIDEWYINLEDMEPLASEKSTSHLPSNTLLLTLSSGQTFRIPPISSQNVTHVHSNVSTQKDPEYSSDSEVDRLRRREQMTDDAQRHQHEVLAKSLRETRLKKSATWQDLVKLVNLQAVISETQELLREAVRGCDALLESDTCEVLRRECSEREEWINRLHSQRDQLLDGSTRVRQNIKLKAEGLARNRMALAAALEHYEQDNAKLATRQQEILVERKRHADVVSSIHSVRTTLIQTASFIFPIEPLSAPDLLFSILEVPLPIPISSSDPAPPLSLPSHPEVTEDTTATALGYVAQVTQLVSAYMGRLLVYPITCCGSRSFCKDPISAMMGPRTFPLYAKGVEIYRFEYAVFLLNKNIEMLMTDRNLRAMDIRHTLPNLKNLLLTLTTGDDIKHTRGPILTALRGPSSIRAVSPLALDAHSQAEIDSSGSATTTRRVARKPSPFLSPLAAILRARYPSSILHPAVKVVDETPEPPSEEEPPPPNAVVANGNDLPSSQPVDHEADEVKIVTEPNGALGVRTYPEGNPLEKLSNGCCPQSVSTSPGLS